MRKVQVLVPLFLPTVGEPIGARYKGHLRAVTCALLFEEQGHLSGIFVKRGSGR
jgi:hypothetical protein